ncbi:unnamed protein product, partial [Larinioides sclopetarius]
MRFNLYRQIGDGSKGYLPERMTTVLNLGIDTNSLKSLLPTYGTFWLRLLTDAIGTFHAKHIVTTWYQCSNYFAFKTNST